jgi:hypothetical protein
MNWGFTATLLTGAAVYALAAVLLRRVRGFRLPA